MKASETAQRWSAAINNVTIGATKDQGGTRGKTVTIGGAKCIPWMSYEGEIGNRPAIALEVWDTQGETWPEELKKHYGETLKDPVAWAKKAAAFGADMLCLRLNGTNPDMGDRGPDESAKLVKDVLAAVDIPLLVWGCGIPEKDNVVLPKVSEVAKGENLLLGTITDKNYRTLVASCLADGHKILAESPLDINIAKQVNILAHDAGYPLENIIMFPTTAAMGYGFDYVLSIMERGRLAGIGGDQLLRQPVLCDVGMEAWRVKESSASEADLPGYGPVSERAVMWETLTATNYLQAGGDILVMRHPGAVGLVKETIERLVAGAKAQAA